MSRKGAETMKRMHGAKTYASAMLRAGLALSLVFLCFDMAAEGRDRSKGKEKKRGVLVSESRPKKVEEEGVKVVGRFVPEVNVDGVSVNLVADATSPSVEVVLPIWHSRYRST